MQITLGTNKKTKERVVWDSDKLVNLHILLVGESGSGKTYTLKGLIHGLSVSRSRLRSYVFDVHSDIDTEHSITKTIVFGENSDYGLQPLAVDPDPQFGGVRKAMKNFMKAFDSFNTSKGDIQHHALETSIIEMYEYYGFFANEPSTWSLHFDKREDKTVAKKQPTVKDLIEFMKMKLNVAKYGINQMSFSLLKELEKKISKVKEAHNNGLNNQDENSEDALNEAKSQAIDAFSSFLDSNWSIDQLEESLTKKDEGVYHSVIKRLEKMYNSGIFKEQEFSFDYTKPVQRFDIRALDVDEKKAFVSLMLNKIYEEEKAKGETAEQRCAIFLDEAKDYSDKDGDGYVERIALEGRKFGIQLVLAGQTLTQFKKETIAQCATKMILGVDTMYFNESSQKLDVPKAVFKKIIHKKTILVSLKNGSKNAGELMEVDI